MAAKFPTLTTQQRNDLEVGLRHRATGRAVAGLLDDAVDNGSLASASLVLSAQPTTTDTIGIGGDTYEFVAAAGNVANDANIAVEIGASAAATRANLIAAINATDADNQHATINNVADTAPALANGTEDVVADEVGTDVRVRTADAPGGNVLGASPSLVLAEVITAAADIWKEGNVNMNTLGGAAPASRAHAIAEVTVTAAMVTNGKQVSFPFTPTRFRVQVTDSFGVVRGNGSDSFAIANDGVLVTFGGGADPDIQATDVLQIEAWE